MVINEMDARLISQAEQISELSATDLVSVSRGEGQPSLNIQFGDLVNAVATVMGTNKLFPFDTRSFVTDANSCIESGIYRSGSTSTNVPSLYGVLVVVKYGDYISQTFHQTTASKSWVRSSSNGGRTWGNWASTDNFGYNTLAELSSGVADMFQLKQESQDIDNLSDVFCFSRVRPSTSSSANGLPFDVWFFLIQFVFFGYNIMQVAISATVPEIKIRTKWNNAWGEWRSVSMA